MPNRHLSLRILRPREHALSASTCLARKICSHKNLSRESSMSANSLVGRALTGINSLVGRHGAPHGPTVTSP